LAAQFDIAENLDRASRRAYPYLIILQHEHAESAATVVAAPVAPPPPIATQPRLHPRIKIDGQPYVIFVAQLAAVPRNQIGSVIGNAAPERYEITRAIDMIFTGI
jgi:toxin CcdB